MAIELITGLPGNSKTLFALRLLIDRASAENRAVYYSGLKDFLNGDERLKGTEWREFDPLTWHETVPSGALIFIDEAQKVFRSRSLGSIPGRHVTELEEHRHKGIDFVMVTQHPSLIDPAVRKLTQVHRHMVRIFGMEASTVHRWDGQVRDNCDKPAGRRDSESVRWVFDKTLYGLYKSADVHTMKRRIPFRVKLLIALPFVLGALVYGVYLKTSRFTRHEVDSSSRASSVAVGGRAGSGVDVAGRGVQPAGSGQGGSVPLAVADPVADARQYAVMNTPRVSGLPQTAPKYDDLTKPTRVPVPAACIQVGRVDSPKGASCRCFTQQGTPMRVEYSMCLEFARNGFFQDFDADRDRAQVAKAESSVGVLNARPDSPLPSRDSDSAGQVLALAAPPTPVKPATVTQSVWDGAANNRATRAVSSGSGG
jgi:zona occludens toxin